MPKNIKFEKLKECLEHHKISGNSLAKLIPCSQAYVCLLINEIRTPSFKMAKRIEQVTEGKVSRTMWYPND